MNFSHSVVVLWSCCTGLLQERGQEHRGFWMSCLWRGGRIECISNIEGDTDRARYSDNGQWGSGVFTQMTRRQNFDEMAETDWTVFWISIGRYVKSETHASKL